MMQRGNEGYRSLLQGIRFERSVADAAALPPANGPEIAFVGRSNAGKSSAINALAGVTRLAVVAKRPGRTQLINIFRLRNGAALVDLPGYGYAEAAASVRRRWQGLLERYLRREAIVGVMLLMDARRPFQPLDRQMVEWFATTGKPIHCLLTKADKLTWQEKQQALRAVSQCIAAHYATLPISVQLFSSLRRIGLAEAEAVIARWLAEDGGLKEKRSSAKGEKAEDLKTSMSIEVPAQGGKAGEVCTLHDL